MTSTQTQEAGNDKSMISIIVPVYNTAPYLDKCIESLVGQTYQDLEIILIDDCSTDGSAEILDRWAAKDNRVRVIHKEKNSGVSNSRNIGLEAAKGEYIGFVDSDDWVETNMYAELCRQLDLTGADAVFSGYNRIEDSGIFRIPVNKPSGTVLSVDDALLEAMPQRGEGRYNLFLVDKAFRRSSIIREGKIILFDPAFSYGEDVLWLTNVLLNCRTVVFCQECGYNYLTTRGGNTWNELSHYRSMKHCISALETNRRMLQLFHDAGSKVENNQLQRVLYYQRYAFRTAARQKNQDLYREYRKGYCRSLIKWYAGNRSLTGLKWFVSQSVSDIVFQAKRVFKKW